MKDIKEVLEMFEKIKAPYFCNYDKLKECFRKEIKKHHPDKMGDEEKAKEIITSFKELEKIYKNIETLEFYKKLYSSSIENTNINVDKKENSTDMRTKRKLIISKKVIILVIFFVFTTFIFGDLLTSTLAILAVLLVLWGYTKI